MLGGATLPSKLSAKSSSCRTIVSLLAVELQKGNSCRPLIVPHCIALYQIVLFQGCKCPSGRIIISFACRHPLFCPSSKQERGRDSISWAEMQLVVFGSNWCKIVHWLGWVSAGGRRCARCSFWAGGASGACALGAAPRASTQVARGSRVSFHRAQIELCILLSLSSPC